jgi:hypothetical protein
VSYGWPDHHPTVGRDHQAISVLADAGPSREPRRSGGIAGAHHAHRNSVGPRYSGDITSEKHRRSGIPCSLQLPFCCLVLSDLSKQPYWVTTGSISSYSSCTATSQSLVRSATQGGACRSDGAPGVEHVDSAGHRAPEAARQATGLGAGVTLLASYVLAVVTPVMTYTEVVWL